MSDTKPRKGRERALAKLQDIHTLRVIEALLRQAPDLSDKHMIGLSNMWRERAADIIVSVTDGISFIEADKRSRGIYDTCRWGEVVSRLARGRGLVLGVAARLACQRRQFVQDDEQSQRLLQQATRLRSDAQRLLNKLVRISPEMASGKTMNTVIPNVERFDASSETTFREVSGHLALCSTFITKCVRDLPKVQKKTGLRPTLVERAKIGAEAARISVGAELVMVACRLDGAVPATTRDRFGFGKRYAHWLAPLTSVIPFERTIATHAKSDADALVSAWLAERFLFADQKCRIVFVSRSYVPSEPKNYDCVVDVGRKHEPKRLWFDHKPPAFEHRDESCATRLIWNHLRSIGMPVGHLENLVDLIHDGDAATRRGSSSAYQQSRKSGIHAHIKHLRRLLTGDQMLYRAVAMWLDGETAKSPLGRRRSKAE